MNNDIHIVLDSIASAAETPLAHDARCHILQLIFRHKAVEWRDGEKTPEEMFKMVKESGELPKTSQPPVGEFLDLFTSLAEEGKKVIGIFVDSVLSGTYHTACMAARQVMQEIPGADIRIFDSLTAATPISALALDILKKADEGAGMDELEVFINGAIARTETCFSVNTLEYLQKGGRIGAVGALLGSLLGIRPVITLDKEGKLVVAAKCRTRSKVLNTMLEISSSHGELERICIAHEGARGKRCRISLRRNDKALSRCAGTNDRHRRGFGHPFGTWLHWTFCTYQRINPARPENKKAGLSAIIKE